MAYCVGNASRTRCSSPLVPALPLVQHRAPERLLKKTQVAQVARTAELDADARAAEQQWHHPHRHPQSMIFARARP